MEALGQHLDSERCLIEWLQRNLPPEIAFEKKSSASGTAAEYLEARAADGFGGTLDFSKCYDCVNFLGTIKLMQAGGFPPPGPHTLCQALWLPQLRWIQWMGHTYQIPLRSGCATAQGCQPHALDGLWLAQGPTRLSSITKIYMDDRSCTARSAQALVCKLKSWQEWSSAVGLQESFSGTCLAASTPHGKQRLLQLWDKPEQVTDSLEVLGATWGRAQTRSAREEDRLEAAKHVIACLGNLTEVTL